MRKSEIGVHIFCPPMNLSRREGTQPHACAVLMRKSEIDAPMCCPPMNSCAGEGLPTALQRGIAAFLPLLPVREKGAGGMRGIPHQNAA
jgi:hypothetical protein